MTESSYWLLDMWQKLQMHILNNNLPIFSVDYYMLSTPTIGNWWSHNHSSLPIMFVVMKVMVWHLVTDSHKYDCTHYCLTFKLLLWIFLSNFIDMYLSSDILLSPWISRSFGNLLRMIIYHHWINCWNCIVMETIVMLLLT
jgi:hypothetical protein